MKQQKIKSVWYSLETVLYGTPQLQSLVSSDTELLPNVNLFKSTTKHWKCIYCSCKFCKTYLKNIGYAP